MLVFLCRFTDCECKQQLTGTKSGGWFDSFHRTKYHYDSVCVCVSVCFFLSFSHRIPCVRKILNKLLFAGLVSFDCLLAVAVCHSCVSFISARFCVSREFRACVENCAAADSKFVHFDDNKFAKTIWFVTAWASDCLTVKQQKKKSRSG